jgi:hypothetical protein
MNLVDPETSCKYCLKQFVLEVVRQGFPVNLTVMSIFCHWGKVAFSVPLLHAASRSTAKPFLSCAKVTFPLSSKVTWDRHSALGFQTHRFFGIDGFGQ